METESLSAGEQLSPAKRPGELNAGQSMGSLGHGQKEIQAVPTAIYTFTWILT